MDKLSITLNIANRVYPMKINRDDEEKIRKSVKKIDERIKFYEKKYAINDKQDLLAMCLIEVATKFESVSDNSSKDNQDIVLKLANIESSLSEII